MVKRGGKEIITVDIEKDIYESLKIKAETGRYTIKEFINNILRIEMERSEKLLKSLPRLSMYGYKKNSTIFVGDKKLGDGFADVFVMDGKMRCDECESYNCEHAQFAALQPEAIELLRYDKKHKNID